MQQNSTNSIISFFWQIIKPYKCWYLLFIPAPIVAAFYPIMQNFILKLFIDLFSIKNITSYKELIVPISIYIGYLVGHEVLWKIRDFAYTKTQPFIRGEITTKCYDKVQYYSYKYFQNTQTGSIVSKIKGIVDGYDDFFNAVTSDILISLLKCIASIAACYFINKEIFYTLLIWAVIFLATMAKLSVKTNIVGEEETAAKHKVIAFISDNITNIFSLFSFASRNREFAKIKNFVNNNSVKKDYEGNLLYTAHQSIAAFIYTIMLCGILFYLIHLKLNNIITTGAFIFVFLATSNLVDNIFQLNSYVSRFIKSLGNFKASLSILQIPQEIIDKENAKELKVSKGEIIFKNVSFAYEGSALHTLKNLNLHIKPGEKVGLVGHSGAGKSTLIALLLKNFKTSNGDIIIDDQSIYDVSSDSLRSQISLIPQDVMLFHRSIRENIGYAKEDATQIEIENAAKSANIHEFIITLPERYGTLVGERGIKLSGGQRQRIGIARAILKNAPILILDEATSSLDSQTEEEIQKSINTVLKANNATVIAIAHRLSTIKHLDRIIVLEGGYIVEDGLFQELLAKYGGRFKAMWDHQICGMVN